MEEMIHAFRKEFVGKPLRKGPLTRLSRRWENSNKTGLGGNGVRVLHEFSSGLGPVMGACELGNNPFDPKWAQRRKILDWHSEFSLFKKITWRSRNDCGDHDHDHHQDGV
jgi:hypothetical protein